MTPVTYDLGTTVRQVRHNGEIKWRGDRIYLTEVPAQEPVGLREIADGRWEIRYAFHLLGYLDERTNTVQKANTWHGQT